MSKDEGANRDGRGATRDRASGKADARDSTARRDESDSTSDEQTKKETVRLSLDVSVELYALIKQLAKDTTSTKSDVLRRAVAMLSVAVEAKRQGKKFGIVEKDHPLTTEIIWL